MSSFIIFSISAFKMSVTHWGEIPKEPTSSFITPNVTADIERSMDKFCLAEYKDDSDMLKTEELL